MEVRRSDPPRRKAPRPPAAGRRYFEVCFAVSEDKIITNDANAARRRDDDGNAKGMRAIIAITPYGLGFDSSPTAISTSGHDGFAGEFANAIVERNGRVRLRPQACLENSMFRNGQAHGCSN